MKKKKLCLLVCVCAVLLAVAGCGSKSSPAPSGGQTEPASAEVSESAPETEAKSEDSHVCTVAIDCTDILENKDKLKEEKAEFLPEDGWMLEKTEAAFTPGETAFDVIKRICGEKKINVSTKNTGESYYIEGINQIYEFDCGDTSGWLYLVNGEMPNYGYSEYEVQDQDEITLKYICDMNAYFAE